ncbi:ROK family protein [Paenibacillus yanchengensis]|uniref:ROK family protein n=1 Tax=Paenibacillus yanchengensis TaxID=2035833 RepID=A0ABW4YGT8_9BACL
MKKYSDQKGSKTTIIQMLRKHGAITRIELAAITQLSKATISIAVNELLELGLVEELEVMPSTGGRPATKLNLTHDSYAVIGVDVNNNEIIVTAFDLRGKVYCSTQLSLTAVDPAFIVQKIREQVDKVTKQLSCPIIPILGVGITGVVDTAAGIVRSSAVLGWQQVPLAKLLQEQLGWTIVIVNRSHARGLSECRFGAGEQHETIIYIGVDSGIGAGLYINRELVQGVSGGAGEIGHTTILLDGPLCACGNKGCLQMVASTTAMEQDARYWVRQGVESVLQSYARTDVELLDMPTICKAGNEGDALASEVIERAATYVGVTLANMVNILNPDSIIIGGSIASECPLYIQAAEKVMRQRAMVQLADRVTVKRGQLDQEGGPLGAITYALDRSVTFAHLYIN